MPMEEIGGGVLFRENLNLSSESLVVGIGGIQEEAEGEYICNATNNIAHASISVTIDVKGIYTTNTAMPHSTAHLCSLQFKEMVLYRHQPLFDSQLREVWRV